MQQVVVQDPLVLVLVDGDNAGAVAHARGHLFEQFIANMLHLLGYEKPSTLNLNVTSTGIELDVSVEHELDGTAALVECKAYSSPVKSEHLSTFYGKLSTERIENPSTRGFLVAIPRLTGDGHEIAQKIMDGDKAFRLLTAIDIWSTLNNRDQVVSPEPPGVQVSDHALVIHSSGLYAACLEIDPSTKTASRVLVRARNGGVHADVLRLLGDHAYAQELHVEDASAPLAKVSPARAHAAVEQIIVEVTGSKSDFEYQLPASPRFFVGRRGVLKEAQVRLKDSTNLLVLNAQSGWGKSSLALRVAAQAIAAGGHALVIDARTASTGGYVSAVLRRAAESAQKAGVLKLPPSASWASISSSLTSLQEASWDAREGRLVIFFDQFENVFKDEELTRQFRDLALLALDSRTPLLVGFAWKTDFVGWTENHPYQLRDEIRNSAVLLSLEPFGPADVDTILNRLQKVVGTSLSREIRQRLREYSQGLPWLLKKLAGHLIQEFQSGKTQEQLVAEALNVANLFESDLAHLSPSEREAVNFIARYAPVQAGEVTERFNAPVVQSLLDQRLVVQVGEKLDTYWDTFRDYLNTGRVPIEDSYILRQSPGSVARLLSDVLAAGGETSVTELTAEWDTSENVVWNVGRELRQLGLALYRPNQIEIIPAIRTSEDPESEVRRRVSQALRRHKAFTAFSQLAERGQGSVTTNHFARQLEIVFPAVEVAESTWVTYARVFLAWFEYAGLVLIDGSTATLAPEGAAGKGALTSTSVRSRTSQSFPTMTPGPCLRLLESLRAGPQPVSRYGTRVERRALGQLLTLGAVTAKDGAVSAADGLFADSGIVPHELLSLLSKVIGGEAALALLESDPKASQDAVGSVIRDACRADWAPATISAAGKSFRAWAKKAGVRVERSTSVL